MSGIPSTQAALDLAAAGRLEDARAMLQRVCQRHPRDADAHHFLGMVLQDMGQMQQAEYYIRRSLELSPRRAQFHSNWAGLLLQLGREQDASRAYEQAIAIDQGYAPAHAGLAGMLLQQGRLGQAETAARQALSLTPHLWSASANLVQILCEQGRTREGGDLLRRLLQAPRPLDPRLLPYLNYCDFEPEEVFRAHAVTGQALVAQARPTGSWKNDRDPDRRLRLGFLSPDFRRHSVAYFLLPILEHRDRAALAAICYMTAPVSDDLTQRFATLADTWAPAASMDDEKLAARVRSDRIDILIDLAGHGPGNRVGLLARAPAPLQLSMIGYPNTTGLPTVGYRIVDALTDPPEETKLTTEELLRPSRCFLCYVPPADAPACVQEIPSVRTGHITFGSFNAMPKLNDLVLRVWTEILRRTPGSRLVVKNRALADQATRELCRARLEQLGIDANRVHLLGPTSAQREHLEAYGDIDVALDTFPYNGTTTTCEALLMGVPVVGMTGRGHAARVGLSLLSAAGLQELVAESTEEYIQLANRLAEDLDRRAKLRKDLRERLLSSPLCDGPAYRHAFGAELRRIWREWCRAGSLA